MQKLFTTAFIKENCGCYNRDGDLSKLKKTYEENNKTCFEEEVCDVTIDEILDSNISIWDKYWFLINKVFDKEENNKISLQISKSITPIYEKKYGENTILREFFENPINKEEILSKIDNYYGRLLINLSAHGGWVLHGVFCLASCSCAGFGFSSYEEYRSFLLDQLKEFCKNN